MGCAFFIGTGFCQTTKQEHQQQLSIIITSGSATISPPGSSQDIMVSKTFSLCRGDKITIEPGTKGHFQINDSTQSFTISNVRFYEFTKSGLVNSQTGEVLLPLAEQENPPAPSNPTNQNNHKKNDSTDESLFLKNENFSQKLTVGGNITPAEGLVFIKDPGWTSFVKIPHRSSFSYGATIQCEAHSKFELSTTDGRLLRVIGPASITVEAKNITVHNGVLLVQSQHKQDAIKFETLETIMELKGTLLVITRDPAIDTTIVRLINGVLSLQSQHAYKGEPWSQYLSANRELAVERGSKPGTPVRLSSSNLLTPFIEGWQVERGNTELPAEFESNEVLSQLRADQADATRPPEAQSSTQKASGKSSQSNDWMRLRMRSTEDPIKRHHYMAFQNYSKARSARESYQGTIEGDSYPVSDYKDQTPEAVDHIPGGPTKGSKDTKLRLMIWHENRLALQLSKIEQELIHQDQARGLHPDSILYTKKRSVRERLYGEDLRMQSRRLISDSLTSLDQLSGRIENINTELALLPHIPANEALITKLKAERSQILQTADNLTDSVRAVIRLH
jgi:hypothetical protein